MKPYLTTALSGRRAALVRFLARKRVARGLHLDAHGRADQVKLFAKSPFQVALVGLAHMLQRVAMNNDDGRVHAALVGIAHLGAEHARALRLLELQTQVAVVVAVEILRLAQQAALES